MSVYSIPAGVSFTHALASAVLEEIGGNYHELPQIKIFLPTSRARRALIDAFLDLAPRGALLLPNIQVIGQYEEHDLSALMVSVGAQDALNDLPPAIDPMLRQGMLAQLIMKVPGRSETPAQAMQLASALSQLLDQIYTEGLDFNNLHALVPDDFAEHWQITLEFLKILGEQWPLILSEMGVMDAAKRRDVLIRKLTSFWLKNPSHDRVIAAGSTGSIPATAEFLKCVANLPNGQVVLPGFDLELTHDDWLAIPAYHPQGGFKKLLSFFEMSADHVKTWPIHSGENYVCASGADRRFLARQIMSPDHGSENWRMVLDDSASRMCVTNALKGLSVCEADHEEGEATLVALKLRSFLEDNNKNAIFITPDRNLARRVISLCQRWGIELDDSGGEPLSKSSDSVFMRLIARWMSDPDDPMTLLQVLKHPLCMFTYEADFKSDFLCEIEKYCFRNSQKYIFSHFLSEEDFDKNVSVSLSGSVWGFWQEMSQAMSDLLGGSTAFQAADINKFSELHKFWFYFFSAGSWLDEGCEKGTQNDNVYDALLTQDLRNALESISILCVCLNEISILEYCDIFDIILKSETSRGIKSSHPRVRILGQMEARVTYADIVIMSGLNEGVWPAEASVDPWMSKSMQNQFGLPDDDQYMSLAAHDFVQAFSQPEVMITRSSRIGGAFSVPSRWLQKLDVLTNVMGIDDRVYKINEVTHYLKLLDQQSNPIAIERPEPNPPIHARPRKLSVTQMEKLLQDPYGIYAGHILNLKKLNDLNEDNFHAVWGMIVHDVLEQFVIDFPDDVPVNAVSILMDKAKPLLAEKLGADIPFVFEEIRLRNLFVSFLGFEKKWRKTYVNFAVEKYASMFIKLEHSTFEILGRGDRFDIQKNGDSIAIIDYKTGSSSSSKALKTLLLPQILIEALMVQQGCFSDGEKHDVDYAGYWYLSGGGQGFKTAEIIGQDNIAPVLDDFHDKIVNLLRYYERKEAVYYNVPSSNYAPRYNDYVHLARIQEWSKYSDGSSNGGDE